MTHRQDRGAEHGAERFACATCGQPLPPPLATHGRDARGRRLGPGAASCPGCGAPVAAGRGAARDAAPAATAVDRSSDAAAAPAPAAALDLPDWLRLAAEAPAIPDPRLSASVAERLPADLVDTNAQPLPPLPDGGLATAMPAWLRAAPAPPNATAPAAPAAAPALAARKAPAAAPPPARPALPRAPSRVRHPLPYALLIALLIAAAAAILLSAGVL